MQLIKRKYLSFSVFRSVAEQKWLYTGSSFKFSEFRIRIQPKLFKYIWKLFKKKPKFNLKENLPTVCIFYFILQSCSTHTGFTVNDKYIYLNLLSFFAGSVLLLFRKGNKVLSGMGDVCSSLVAHLAAVAATRVRILASCQILYR